MKNESAFWNYDMRVKERTIDGLRNILEADLTSDNFENFCLACNFISQIGYINNDHDWEDFDYYHQKEFRDLANQEIRKRFGTFSERYDMIVKESKQELWGGDELYKLFDYACKPYYVRGCLKGALCVTAMMECGIKTIEDCLTVSKLIMHPPYWDLYDNNVQNKQQIMNVEINKWLEIAQYLFKGDIAGAYNCMMNAINASNGNSYSMPSNLPSSFPV